MTTNKVIGDWLSVTCADFWGNFLKFQKKFKKNFFAWNAIINFKLTIKVCARASLMVRFIFFKKFLCPLKNLWLAKECSAKSMWRHDVCLFFKCLFFPCLFFQLSFFGNSVLYCIIYTATKTNSIPAIKLIVIVNYP